MPGFNGIQQVVDAELEGRVRSWQWRKTPSAVTTAGIWFDLATAAGNPKSKNWFDAAPLTAAFVKQSADGGIFHGAAVSPSQLHLRKTLTFCATATALPMQMMLCDYLLYYPTIDDAELVEQTMTNTPNLSATFTASASTNSLTYTSTTHNPDNILTTTPVTLSSTGTLPAGLDDVTTYYLIRESTTTCKLATSVANARAGTFVDITDTGSGVHTIKWLMPRYTDGVGVQMMAITLAARTGGQKFTVNYTNSDGVAGRTSRTMTQNTSGVIGTITTSVLTPTNDTSAGPFIGLQDGDSGVRSVEGVTMLGGDTGLFALVLVKPISETQIRGIDAPVEKDHLLHGAVLPRIYDDAFLNYLCLPNGSLAASAVIGNLKMIYN